MKDFGHCETIHGKIEFEKNVKDLDAKVQNMVVLGSVVAENTNLKSLSFLQPSSTNVAQNTHSELVCE